MVQTTLSSETLAKAYERSRDVFAGLAGETRDFYDEARRWVPEHSGMVAVVSSTAVGCWLIGYLAGRRNRPAAAAQAVSRQRDDTATAVPLNFADLDIAPFFKFLKLWMLYRVATRD